MDDARELREQIETWKGTAQRWSEELIKKDVEIFALKRAEAERIEAAKPPDHSREIASRSKMVDAAMNDLEEMDAHRCGAWYDATTITEQMLWPDTKPPPGWPEKWHDFGDYVRKAYGLTASGTKLLEDPSSPGQAAPPVVDDTPVKHFLSDAVARIVGDT
jgi:hypothetical protein